MKLIRITWCLAAAALVLGCEQTTEPPADDAAASPLFAPADGNEHKAVITWEDYYEDWVDCGGGATLDLHDYGWGQRNPPSGWNDHERKKWVWHVELTYINPATGRHFRIVDVGPDNVHIDEDGNIIRKISGRVVTSHFENIGHVVYNHTTKETLHVSGRSFG
ncbi:MAG: hypothetical protein WBP17_10405, partial [Gemmatimonadota bacterium]